MRNTPHRSIGICLSGGGMRAAAFHAGVLKWLADTQQLEHVSHVSSVSGGSIFIGLLFHISNYKWPSSGEYQNHCLEIKNILTSNCLQSTAKTKALSPLNWHRLTYRANIVAESINELFQITGTLGDLPPSPTWSINGTTAENGKRFRFKKGTGGDYSIGYADMTDFPIANAMAMSAAFPGGIGPLKIASDKYVWRKAEWGSQANAKPTTLQQKTLHLYDGGVYDNLGVEPLYDCGTQRIKSSNENVDFLIVSDAGKPFATEDIPHPLNPFRFKRLMDIMSEQTRALRVRSIVNFIKNNPSLGMYLQIGTISSAPSFQNLCPNGEMWLDEKSVSYARSFPTSLLKMTPESFDTIFTHGYETAKLNSLLLPNTE
ncbi:patatin-like phospholipase family protein [Bdellovibrio bacteriovorus]|uniref:PNPLA domain-containing protein n=1 Tax=Bdellovibrio bacteriovorus TaxID=959 RepID=A0A1Z3N6A0_BDEBC|nr:patatin-like phospholipase family protein [Bdellovibrio bacteriovorus]ASD63022.1 hypothetical protein B9G79_05285 [Bdellovibrio bacteriovorus]